jgi:uncharacterized protein
MPTVIKEQLSQKEIDELGVMQWPIWTKEVSRFDWTYDGTEQCLFLEGDVIVETEDGNFHLQPGDFVTFEAGLSCVWDIKKPVKKHYNFP